MAGKHRIKVVLWRQIERTKIYIEDFPKIFYIAFKTIIRTFQSIVPRLELRWLSYLKAAVRQAIVCRGEFRWVHKSPLPVKQSLVPRLEQRIIAATRALIAAEAMVRAEFRLFVTVHVKTACSAIVRSEFAMKLAQVLKSGCTLAKTHMLVGIQFMTSVAGRVELVFASLTRMVVATKALVKWQLKLAMEFVAQMGKNAVVSITRISMIVVKWTLIKEVRGDTIAQRRDQNLQEFIFTTFE